MHAYGIVGYVFNNLMHFKNELLRQNLQNIKWPLMREQMGTGILMNAINVQGLS